MKNSFWEEQQMPDPDIRKFHQSTMEQFGVPTWLASEQCPFCKKDLPLRSIRSVGVRFNTRNMGDVVVEFACDSCGQMDVLYYRQVVADMKDFSDLMRGDKPLPAQAKPVVEELMYKEQYNNVMEKMMSGYAKPVNVLFGS